MDSVYTIGGAAQILNTRQRLRVPIETITWLRDENWLIVTDDGHYRGSPQVDRMLVYVVETDDGTQRIMTRDEFAAKYDWQNDPEQVRLLR